MKQQINLHKGFIHNIKGKIVFKNINFVYPDGKLNTLKNISFEINKGQICCNCWQGQVQENQL